MAEETSQDPSATAEVELAAERIAAEEPRARLARAAEAWSTSPPSSAPT